MKRFAVSVVRQLKTDESSVKAARDDHRDVRTWFVLRADLVMSDACYESLQIWKVLVNGLNIISAFVQVGEEMSHLDQREIIFLSLSPLAILQ